MTAAFTARSGLIEATEPPEYRGAARDGVRMLVSNRRTQSHAHARFYDLPSVLRPGDLLVVNDSATLPAAIPAQRETGGAIALHVSTKIDERLWIVEPREPVVAGEKLTAPHGARATMLAPVDPERPRTWYAAFELSAPMYAYIADVGLPITYAYLGRTFPLRDYQTIFARAIGSSEMPSAGRPFTKRILDRLRDRGVEIATITLHCGVASFEVPERPGTERFSVSTTAADRVNVARRQERRVVAVGTTVVRALESAATGDGVIASQGWTNLFIDENHRLNAVDALLTGFHAANATHVGMLRAFIDSDVLDDAYAEAAARGYRCHEFGDVHLIQ